MDVQKRSFLPNTNKEQYWEHKPPTIDDLFEDFINSDYTHEFNPRASQGRYADDPHPMFDEGFVGQLSSLSSANTYSNPGTDPISIEEAAVVDEYCFWESPFVPPQSQASGSCYSANPSIGASTPPEHSPVDIKEGIWKHQLQSFLKDQGNLTKELPSRPATATAAASAPLSVPARRVNTPRILRDSFQESLVAGRKGAQTLLHQTTQPNMATTSMNSQQSLWERRRGQLPVHAHPAMQPIAQMHQPAHPVPRSRGRQRTPYAFEHDYSNFTDSTPFNADLIEPLSPFTTAYTGFPGIMSPLASSPLLTQRHDLSSDPQFREVNYQSPQKVRGNIMPYYDQGSDAGLMSPPISNVPSQGQWPSMSPAFQEESISPAVHGFDFGFDHITAPTNTPAFDNNAAWWAQDSTNQSTCGANGALLGLGIDTGIDPDLLMGGNTIPSSSGAIDQSIPSYDHLFTQPPTPAIPLNTQTIAPRHLSLGNPMIAGGPTFSPSGLLSPSLPSTTIPPLPKTPKTHTRHTSGHHLPNRPQPITTSSTHILSPRKTRSPTRSPTAASQSGVQTTKSRSRSSHHQRRKSSSRAGGMAVGFVNFTPDDSMKLLTGVAPSGSSKTKARREKEAQDERRKLGEVAKKVVLQAGGDLGCLEEVGLLSCSE